MACLPLKGILGPGHTPRRGLFGPVVTRAEPPLSIATRIEDWASQGQPKRKPEIPVVFENPDATREKRRGSNVFTG